MPSAELYNRLKTEIDRIPVIDMHEHLILPEKNYLETGTTYGADFTRFMFWYTVDDLQCSGMEMPDQMEYCDTLGAVFRIDGNTLPLDDKWKYIQPYWEQIRFFELE